MQDEYDEKCVYCDLPAMECVHCGAKWQEDDYYQIQTGSEITCPACEKTNYVVGEDTTITVVISKEPE